MTRSDALVPGPGRPAPLGVHWDGSGVDVAVRSASAQAVDVCLFDDDGTEVRVRLRHRTGDVWHGHLPGVRPGQRYGLRVHGPFDPAGGQRHNPAKLLLDPYARAVEGSLRLDDAVFGSVPGSDGVADLRDSAPFVPRSVVVDEAFDWAGDAPPRTPWSRTVVYELHVKGFTATHPGVPEHLRGTYAGLAHPAAVAHLLDLGVTAVELLPVAAFVSEPHLLRRGLTNYWGYGPVAPFAPHGAYSSSVVSTLRACRRRSRSTSGSSVGPSTPQFQERLCDSPSRPPSPLASLCFASYAVRSCRVNPSCAVTRLTEAQGARTGEPKTSEEPDSR